MALRLQSRVYVHSSPGVLFSSCDFIEQSQRSAFGGEDEIYKKKSPSLQLRMCYLKMKICEVKIWNRLDCKASNEGNGRIYINFP